MSLRIDSGISFHSSLLDKHTHTHIPMSLFQVWNGEGQFNRINEAFYRIQQPVNPLNWISLALHVDLPGDRENCIVAKATRSKREESLCEYVCAWVRDIPRDPQGATPFYYVERWKVNQVDTWTLTLVQPVHMHDLHRVDHRRLLVRHFSFLRISLQWILKWLTYFVLFNADRAVTWNFRGQFSRFTTFFY